MPIYFSMDGLTELTHEEVFAVGDELMNVCAKYLRDKYGEGKVPVAFAIFAGSGLSHVVCATMPKEIAGQALIDAGGVLLGDGELEERTMPQPELFN